MMMTNTLDDTDVIAKIFPSFYQSTKTPNEFLIYDSFDNVIETLLEHVEEVFKLEPYVAKVMLNHKYVTIFKMDTETMLFVGNYVDHVICRIFRGHATFWSNESFIDDFEKAVTVNADVADDLIISLREMYDGDVALIPLNTLRRFKKICSRIH